MSNPIITAAAEIDLTIMEGSSWESMVTFDAEDANNMIDLFDYEFRGFIKRTIYDTSPMAKFDFEVFSSSELRMILTAKESTKLDTRVARYDVEMYQTDANTNIETYVGRILQGKIKISREVTAQ